MPLEADMPPISGVTYRLFAHVVKRYFRRHFRSVMTQRAELLEKTPGPLIVYANHSSWWDPMLCLLLARSYLPAHKHYAPMDAEALKRYPILKKIGMFPVETATATGVLGFLRTSEAILRAGGVLWLTPQGRFADVREFPLRFKPGLAILAARMPGLSLLPMAIEYTFWDERLPETLVRFGDVVRFDENLDKTEITHLLESALAATMLDLQHCSAERDSAKFALVLTGRRGSGGLYGRWQRLRGLVRGKSQVDHTVRS
jgi:1-acyl-sn-glycerol-3-phosphate acyltransferase